MYDRLTTRELGVNPLKKNNLDKSESKNTENPKKKNKYPMISNIVINSNNQQQTKSNVMTPGNNTNKKKDLIINKIEMLDEKKLNKLARVVEELSNNKYEDETGNSILFNSKKFDESNQFFNSNEKVSYYNVTIMFFRLQIILKSLV